MRLTVGARRSPLMRPLGTVPRQLGTGDPPPAGGGHRPASEQPARGENA